MKDRPNLEKLKEVLAIAERTLEEIKDENTHKAKKRRKKITKAVEKAYEMLNKKEYTEKEIKKRTDDVWISLMDDDHFIALLIFFFGFVLAGAAIFAIFQAYAFIQNNWIDEPKKDTEQNWPQDEISELVSVEYKENNIVNLYDQMTVSDEVGVQNTPQEFTIRNDSKKVPSLNYTVNYSVDLVPMNDPKGKILDKKYIKYKYIYTNSWTGKSYESKIRTLDSSNVNPDGSITIATGTQLKDNETKFKVIFWLSSEAQDDQQGATYTMAFKVNASIMKK